MSFDDAIKPIADRATIIINGNEDTLALLERIDELEAVLTEWRDWYRMAFGTDYTAKGIVGRTDRLLQNEVQPS